METTYRLRDGLTWHDGAPLTAEDFAFALRVYKDPDLGFFLRATQDYTRRFASRFDHLLVHKREWEPAGKGTALAATSRAAYLNLQQRADPLPRFRRCLNNSWHENEGLHWAD